MWEGAIMTLQVESTIDAKVQHFYVPPVKTNLSNNKGRL